jgi:ubiquinone/menaquinone biosynthesis C-methylase UbiE
MNMGYFDIVKPASNEWNLKFSEWLAANYLHKDMKILDLGCGRGTVVAYLKDMGYNAQGYDYPDIDLEKPMKLKDNSYDFILLKFVIEHVTDINQLFSEITRILKPGGLVLILTDDYPRQWKEFYDDPTHKTPMTKARLKTLARINNLLILSCRRWRNLPYVWRYSINAFDYTFFNAKQLIGVFQK